MKIKLVKRKPNKKGRITMYIEIYKGYTKNNLGKIEHDREYVPLEIFLYSKPKTNLHKKHNKEMEALAEAVKAKMIIDLKNNQHGFSNSDKGKIKLLDYFQSVADEKENTGSQNNYKLWLCTLKHLTNYCSKNKNIKLNQVNESFIKGFIKYLLNDVKTKTNKNLSQNSASTYYKKFKACMNQAERNRLITFNPCKNVKGISEIQTERQFLTLEELTTLLATECKYPILKKAFLFGCFSGLRISDIQKLKWEQIIDQAENSSITFRQQKTKELEYQKLHPQAREILGDRGEKDSLVFPKVQNETYYNNILQGWINEAGIDKKITFHCSRHTFAMLLIEFKANIAVIQKLLGHKKLSTTQIYAKILDKQKEEALNLIPSINTKT